VLVDTAGIRRQSRFADGSEFYAGLRALQALERADIACLVVDATEGFQKQDARLAHQAFDAGRPVLLLYNKWDRIEERERRWKEITAERRRRYPTLADLPALPVSATRGLHLHRLPGLVRERWEQATRRVPTPQLNRWLAEAEGRRQAPSTAGGKAPRLYYATQTGSRPPEFTMFVNDPRRLSAEYRRYLRSRLVERFGFHGTPVRLRFRART